MCVTTILADCRYNSVSCNRISPHNAVCLTHYDLIIFILVNSIVNTLSHTWDSWTYKDTSPCLLDKNLDKSPGRLLPK